MIPVTSHNPYYEIFRDKAPVTGIIRVHGIVTYCKEIVLLECVFCNCIVQRLSCFKFYHLTIQLARKVIERQSQTFGRYCKRAPVFDVPTTMIPIICGRFAILKRLVP